MKEILLEMIKVNPMRTTRWAELDPENPHLQHLPTDRYVRIFMARHKLVMRRSMPLNQGRAILTVQDLREWQNSTETALFSDPVTAEIMNDPSRVFNQDETPLCPGVEHQRVLTEKGWTGPVYNQGGDSRLHITCSVTASADGEYVGVRLVYKGVRNRFQNIRDIPDTGITGRWRCSVAPNGYANRDVYLEVLGDLVEHIREKNVSTPVLLFIDGYGGHLSPEISDFATENGIIMRLLR